MDVFMTALSSVWANSGYASLTVGNIIMMIVGAILLYMAIVKGFEPLLLGSIAFGCIMANFPKTGFMTDPGLMKIIHLI